MTYWERNAWIDRCASLFAGFVLALAIIVVFAPWIMRLLDAL